eukprot:m.226989 g.226989  ORF g.226989 m.226989 type:complete len:386 (-) comp15172_c0_seq1:1476-2633(-)
MATDEEQVLEAFQQLKFTHHQQRQIQQELEADNDELADENQRLSGQLAVSQKHVRVLVSLGQHLLAAHKADARTISRLVTKLGKQAGSSSTRSHDELDDFLSRLDTDYLLDLESESIFKALSDETIELREQLHMVNEKCVDLQRELDSQQAQLEQLGEDRRRLLNDKEELEGQLEMNGGVEDSRDRSSELEESTLMALNRSELQALELEQKVESYRCTITQLQQDLADEQETNQFLQQDNDELRAKVQSDLESSLEVSTNGSLLDEVNATKQLSVAQQRMLVMEKNHMKMELEFLKDDLRVLKPNYITLHATCVQAYAEGVKRDESILCVLEKGSKSDRTKLAQFMREFPFKTKVPPPPELSEVVTMEHQMSVAEVLDMHRPQWS